MAAMLEDHQPFEHLLNFRDAGRTINNAARRPLLKEGLLFRSARPDEATPADRHRLLTSYTIKTILDLRTNTEHVEQAGKASAKHTPSSTHAPGPLDPLAQIAGIRYARVNVNGTAYRKALIKQLTWSQTAKLAGLYAVGYRKEAISVLGVNVMAPRGLVGLAEDSLLHSTAEVKAVFDLLADETTYPVMIHCTQGKDRTGLVVLLMLLLLKAPHEAIELDYRMSERELLPEREEKLQEIRSIGLPDSFADCPADWVTRVTAFLDDRGGVERYLESCGVTTAAQAQIRSTLTT